MTSDRDLRTFDVCQAVVLHVGKHDMPATVVEDRGILGVDGGRIIRVSVLYEEDSDPSEFEVPASAPDAPTVA